MHMLENSCKRKIMSTSARDLKVISFSFGKRKLRPGINMVIVIPDFSGAERIGTVKSAGIKSSSRCGENKCSFFINRNFRLNRNTLFYTVNQLCSAICAHITGCNMLTNLPERYRHIKSILIKRNNPEIICFSVIESIIPFAIILLILGRNLCGIAGSNGFKSCSVTVKQTCTVCR